MSKEEKKPSACVEKHEIPTLFKLALQAAHENAHEFQVARDLATVLILDTDISHTIHKHLTRLRMEQEERRARKFASMACKRALDELECHVDVGRDDLEDGVDVNVEDLNEPPQELADTAAFETEYPWRLSLSPKRCKLVSIDDFFDRLEENWELRGKERLEKEIKHVAWSRISRYRDRTQTKEEAQEEYKAAERLLRIREDVRG